MGAFTNRQIYTPDRERFVVHTKNFPCENRTATRCAATRRVAFSPSVADGSNEY